MKFLLKELLINNIDKLIFILLLYFLSITGVFAQSGQRISGATDVMADILRYDFLSKEDIYYLEPEYFKSYINNIGEQRNLNMRHFSSPAQIIYFDSFGDMVSFNSNTLIDNKRDSLNKSQFSWNTTKMYNFFPPTNIYNSRGGRLIDYSDKSSPFYLPKIQIERDSIFKYLCKLTDIKSYHNTKSDSSEWGKDYYDYEIFIFASHCFLTQYPLYLLETIEENLEKNFGHFQVKVHLVMTDIALIGKNDNRFLERAYMQNYQGMVK